MLIHWVDARGENDDSIIETVLFQFIQELPACEKGHIQVEENEVGFYIRTFQQEAQSEHRILECLDVRIGIHL